MMQSISATKASIRLPDPKIVAKAVAEDRIVLTFDLDSGDILATAGSEGPSVVIVDCEIRHPPP